MAELTRVLTEEDVRRRSTGSAGLDLAPYLHIIDNVLAAGGLGGEVQLEAGETQRTEKGRLTRAAKQLGRKLIWRKGRNGTLKFVLATPGEPTPGGHQRRPPAEQQAEQAIIDAVMTEDVADVTDTEASPTADTPPRAARARGRGRRG